MTSEARFFAKTAPGENGCIVWTGGTCKDGYGKFRFRSTDWKAHRVAWVLSYGEIPAGMHVLHRCDNPPCVYSGHLFLGTHDDNMQDKIDKGRGFGNFPSGEENPNAKLDWEKVREIRALRGQVSQRTLARRYGVSQNIIGQCQRGNHWKEAA